MSLLFGCKDVFRYSELFFAFSYVYWLLFPYLEYFFYLNDFFSVRDYALFFSSYLSPFLFFRVKKKY